MADEIQERERKAALLEELVQKVKADGEGKKPIPGWNHDGDTVYTCGECEAQLHFIGAKYKFCPECGTKVKW